jgi:predicted metalloprotease with PDZ domain
LTNVVDDRVKVSLNAKLVGLADAENNKYTFHFPATIPGTYATLDYGRFIHDFKAFDASGTRLKATKTKNS